MVGGVIGNFNRQKISNKCNKYRYPHIEDRIVKDFLKIEGKG